MILINKSKERQKNRISQAAIALVWLFAAAFFYAAVIRAVFGGTIWDKGFYAAAALIFAVVLTALVRSGFFDRIATQCRMAHFWRHAAQVCSFACICLMTLYYYNSASNYGHAVATRVMNSAFGIALLCMYRKEELQKKWICYVQTIAFCLFALGSILKKPEGKELVLYTLSGITVWVYIKLLGALAGRIRRKETCRHFSGYGCMVLLFLLLLVVLRNTRAWVFSVTIPFGCLYLYRFDKTSIDRFLRNFCYGCIMAFWLMFGSALLFRPYYSFEFIRYPGWFSSVASAGLFWMLVFGCILACILAKYDNTASVGYNLKNSFFEFVTLGAVSSYLIMGMARTALLGTAVFSMVTFLTAELFCYHDTVKKMLTKLLLVICPALVLFPVVYTLTRCVPALVGRPVWITRAEWFSDRIEKQEPMDSSKFMNVPQLAESLLEKLLGIDINLSSMAGAVSGPGESYTIDENGELVFDDNVVGYYEKDGQIYTRKDYSFENDATQDTSNGRLDIWRMYLSQLNLTGHDTMIVESAAEDMILYHAHNSYIQVAYDHGIAVGILFVLIVGCGLICAVIYYKRNCQKVKFAIYPVIVVISFMIAGMTEWVFHPSIPLGFALMIGLTPLVGRTSGQAEAIDA